MANTYTQLYIHVVFAVKYRASLISVKWKEQLYQYITGIIKGKKQKLMIINGMPDHLHLLIGINPDCNLSDLVRDIKACSSKWINDNKLTSIKFQWQTGFSAFSKGQAEFKTIYNYIQRQEEHHRKKTFREEQIEILSQYEIEYHPAYLLYDWGVAPTEP